MFRGRVTRGLSLAIATQVVVSLLFVWSVGGDRDLDAAPRLRTASAPDPVAAAPLPETTEPVPAPALDPIPAPAPAPAPTGPRRAMFIGDSMSWTAAGGLAPVAPQFGFDVINEGINGCGVVRGGPYRYFGGTHQTLPKCEAWPQEWQAAVNRHHPDMVVIMIGRWELMDRTFNGAWTNIFDPAFAAYVDTEIDQALTIAGSTGARVVLMSSPYYLRGLDPSGGRFPEDDPARVDAVNQLMRNTAARRGVPFVELGAWLSPEGHYTADVAGVKVRSDGVHLTRETGPLLAPWLFPQLAAL